MRSMPALMFACYTAAFLAAVLPFAMAEFTPVVAEADDITGESASAPAQTTLTAARQGATG